METNTEKHFQKLRAIAYEFSQVSVEKQRQEIKRYQARINKLEELLITKYNDNDTVKSVFEVKGPSSEEKRSKLIAWNEFKAKHPGENEALLKAAFEDDYMRSKELERLSEEEKKLKGE